MAPRPTYRILTLDVPVADHDELTSVGKKPNKPAQGSWEETTDIPDLVILEDSLVFYAGRGDGLFDGQALHDTALSRFGVMGDVDGDGRLDIVSASTPGSQGAGLRTFRGNGAGMPFLDAVYSPYQCTGYFPCLADFNEDGLLDVVLNGLNMEHICLYFADAMGSFPAHIEIATGADARAVRVGDFDLDGHEDLLVSLPGPGELHLYQGRGDGSFESPRAVSLPCQSPPFCAAIEMVVSDVNADQWPDVVLHLGEFIVLLNDGAGNLVFSATLDVPLVFVDHLAAVDLNDDGYADMVALGSDEEASASSDIAWLMNDGQGGFLSAEMHREVAGPSSLAMADFNGDGNVDVAVAGLESEMIAIHDGDGIGGLGSFSASVPALQGRSAGLSSHSENLTADEFPDVVVATGLTTNGEVWLFAGLPGGGFVQDVQIPGAEGANDIELGDLNLDGVTDVVLAERTWRAYMGDGAGGFSGGPGHSPSAEADSIELGDVNEDGWPDVVVALGDRSEVRVYLSNGDGGFMSPHVVSSTSAREVAIADVDDDGHLDLMTAWFSPAIYFGNGTGTFSQPMAISTAVQSPRLIIARDMDADGLLDLAIVGDDASTAIDRGRVDIVRNTANRTFETIGSYAIPLRGLLAEALDADGDGYLDLAIAGGNSVAIMRGLSGGVFTPLPIAFGIGSNAVSRRMATSDLNQDGRPDLAVMTLGSEDISVLYNRSPQYPSRSLRALQGGVNSGRGTLSDVLFVNGDAGDQTRTVPLAPFDPLQVSLVKPPSRQSRPQARFALFAWRRVPSDSSVVELPFGAGLLAFPIPAVGGFPQPKVTWNNFRHFGALGMPDMPSDPAPSTPLDLPGGVGFPVTFTLQALIADDGAAGEFPASPSNGVVVVVQ
jgi:hypothetical protein